MEKQNYKNHSKLVLGFHYFGATLCGALFIGSIVNLINSNHDNIYSAALLILVSILLILIGFYARAFALKAQDRAIRAEENFRHYLLTGKPMSPDLRMRQIIALRFASDEEFVELVQKAVSEKLPAEVIKKLIKNWKADTYRV